MFAKINHVAMLSTEYATLGKFYECLFGMKTSANSRSARAVTVGDGYVGLNINPRRPGRPGGLDHFGMQVEDVELVFERMEKSYPSVNWLKRPSTRPFAGITTHDPDGNVFDLSQSGMKNRTDVYEDGEWKQERFIDHFAFRTLHPEQCAQFYTEVFELNLTNRKEGDDHYCVTDGRVTLVIMPWDINFYEGTGIVRPGPDHFGFSIESLDAFKKDIEDMSQNYCLMPKPLGMGPEGKKRLKLFDDTCPFGDYHITDIDGVLIDVTERAAA